MEQAPMTTAEKLRYYRKASAMTHQQMADALNINRTTYTKYESGKSNPSLQTITKIAEILNISPLELLPRSEDERPPQKLRDTPIADSPIYQLSDDERGLIAKYRVLNREQKPQAQALIGNLSKKEK